MVMTTIPSTTTTTGGDEEDVRQHSDNDNKAMCTANAATKPSLMTMQGDDKDSNNDKDGDNN